MNSNKKLTPATGVPQPFKGQAGSARQFKPLVAPPKTGVTAQSVKRPEAPPVYRPHAKPIAAPPPYRPQTVPKVLQTRKSVSEHTVQRKTHMPLTRAARLTIQLAEQRVQGLSGIGLGNLSVASQSGEFNTTTAQAQNPAPQVPTTLRSSKPTKTSTGILVHWARVDHLGESENTHAEDKVPVLMLQSAAFGDLPSGSTVQIDHLFISASPCTSTKVGELEPTSDKSSGCTENLIAWHKTGIDFGEMGCSRIIKLKIGHLEVHHLYKGNTHNGAKASYNALERLKAAGVINGFLIQNAPKLTGFNLPLQQ